MDELTDPLTLLREHTVNKLPISLVGDHVVFGRVRCARAARVRRRHTADTRLGARRP